MLEKADKLQIEDVLLTGYIQAFDSANHLFLISALEKYGFKNNFIRWIKSLLKYHEWCIIDRGQTTNYFELERVTKQGDSQSAYLFIIVLKIAFIKIKRNPNIKSLNVCNNDFLYTAYADEPTCFYKIISLEQNY